MKTRTQESVFDLERAIQYTKDAELVELADRVFAKRHEVIGMQIGKVLLMQAFIEAERKGAGDSRTAILEILNESANREEAAFSDIITIRRAVFGGGDEDE